MDLSRRTGSPVIGSTPEYTGTTDSLAQFAKEEVLVSNRQENEVCKFNTGQETCIGQGMHSRLSFALRMFLEAVKHRRRAI
jgi:hypothetical protein